MHNTGNPIGSKDILDLYDNSEVVDNFVNSQQDETPDRFGQKRLTLAGLIKRSMALRNEINDFSGTLTFKPEWSDVPMNVSEGVGGDGGALNLQAEALGNRSEINKITSREALRRSYAEAGYTLVTGSFEAGGTLVKANDVLLQERTGKAFSGPAGAVSAGTDPASGGFVDRSVLTAVKRRTLSWFGAREGENSTSAILAAATSGLDIVVDVNTKIVDQSITLSSGQSWVDGGGSIRQECALLNPQPTNPNSPYGVSSTPLFKLSSAGSCVDGVTMYPAFEAVQMSAASKFKNNKCYGEGRTWYDGVNAFASSCEVFGNEIVDFGQWLPGITYAQRGDGIFFSNSASFNRHCTARDNVVRGCAKNGVLAIGCKMVRIADNVLIGNRMSAIQIAFLSSLGSDNASGIIVKGNLGEYNGADSFDCNNKTSNPPENTSVNAIVTNNVFRSNGWIYPTREEQLSRTGTKQESPDGGACTLINVSRVSYIDNDIYDNARACAYINNSPECIVSDNRYYKETSATGDDTDGFRVVNSKSCIIERNFARVPRVAYRFDGNCSGTIIAGNNTKTTVSGADAIVTPNGAIIGEFSDNVVEIVNGNWFTNGIITPKRCKFVATVAGSTTFRLPDDSDFDGNEFTFPQGNLTFDGLVRLGINGLKVSTSTASASGSVRVRNLSGICRFKDVKINQGGSTAALLLDGGSFTLYIRDGRIAHTASGNNIRVISGSSAMVIRTDGVDLSTGFSDFTGAARQQLTWA